MKRTNELVGRVKGSAFLRHNTVYFFGSLAAGVLNYLYYPVLGHLLKLGVYGEVQALVALSLQLTIFITVLSQVTVNVAATYESEADKQRISFELEKLALYVSIGVFIIGALLSTKLRSFFHFDSVWPFIVLLLFLVVTGPSSFRSAYLNGHKKFGLTAAYNILAAGSRLLFSILFVEFGWGAVGAIGGLVVSQLLAFAYTAYQTHKIGFGSAVRLQYLSMPQVKTIVPELKLGLFIFVSSLGITVLSSIDVLVVKHYFDVQTAGRYSGVSSVARIIYFITASIAQVLLPSVKRTRPRQENERYFLKSLGLLTIVGGVVTLGFTLLPHLTVTTLMGGQYSRYANLLPRLSLAMLLISVLNLIVYYNIALRNYAISAVVLSGTAVACLLMMVHHNSLVAVVDNLVWGSIFTIVLFVIWELLHKLHIRSAYAEAE